MGYQNEKRRSERLPLPKTARWRKDKTARERQRDRRNCARSTGPLRIQAKAGKLKSAVPKTVAARADRKVPRTLQTRTDHNAAEKAVNNKALPSRSLMDSRACHSGLKKRTQSMLCKIQNSRHVSVSSHEKIAEKKGHHQLCASFGAPQGEPHEKKSLKNIFLDFTMLQGLWKTRKRKEHDIDTL